MPARTMTLIEIIATCLVARANCIKSGNAEWKVKHEDTLEACADLLPSGGGFDSGTKIDLDASREDKIVFLTAFHHMNDSGMYDGWTDHVVTAKPSFIGINVTVGGRNRRDIKDYIGETFDYALTRDVEWSEDGVRWAAMRTQAA